MSAFIARHIEHPGSLHSKPDSINILSRPSRSACSFTSPEPGTIIAFTWSATFLFLAISDAALKSSIRPLVHDPINTLSILTSFSGVLGERPIYSKALIIDFFLLSSLSSSGFGTKPSIETTSSGLVPHVTWGIISLASISMTLS